jgi:serine/threonine protein kinase
MMDGLSLHPVSLRRLALPRRSPSIEGYRLGCLLGQGRTAAIYLAEHRRRGGRVALKVPRVSAAAHDPNGRRFAIECELLASIRDRHVVGVVEHRHGGAAYLAMEYLGGGSLRRQMSGPLDPVQALALLGQAALGLQALHANGIVHRDVKPENLLARERGELVLVDLGVAARQGDSAAAVAAGTMLGTLRYAAPEQLQGAAPNPAADVYSLGIVLYELLCGRPPFGGATPLELLAQHLMATVPRLPRGLACCQPLIDRMLDKRPHHRPADAGALLREIQRMAPCPADGSGT